MVRQQDGHILTVASLAGRSGSRGQAAYAAAKAGLLGFTLALAREHGADNIRVNTILPGVLPTPMTDGLGEARLKEFADHNTLRRLNDTPEVANFIAFLARTRNISGQVFQLDSRPAPWS
jgi:NAD(P)-dependent dehydrogenase (short-subunit alcohol dehydrogenase family)